MRILLTVVNTLACVVMLAGCSRPYGPDEAEKRGDIVDLHGMIRNEQRLEEFLSNVQKGRKDKVRITQYTVEADPVFHDLSYDGNSIRYRFDNSQDAYGDGKVRTSSCSGLSNDTVTEHYASGDIELTEYKLTGCTGKNAELAHSFRVGVRTEDQAVQK